MNWGLLQGLSGALNALGPGRLQLEQEALRNALLQKQQAAADVDLESNQFALDANKFKLQEAQDESLRRQAVQGYSEDTYNAIKANPRLRGLLNRGGEVGMEGYSPWAAMTPQERQGQVESEDTLATNKAQRAAAEGQLADREQARKIERLRAIVQVGTPETPESAQIAKELGVNLRVVNGKYTEPFFMPDELARIREVGMQVSGYNDRNDATSHREAVATAMREARLYAEDRAEREYAVLKQSYPAMAVTNGIISGVPVTPELQQAVETINTDRERNYSRSLRDNLRYYRIDPDALGIPDPDRVPLPLNPGVGGQLGNIGTGGSLGALFGAPRSAPTAPAAKPRGW